MAAKVFFVLLVLVAVAFFLTMRMGAGRSDPESDSDKSTYLQEHPPPGWAGNLIAWLSPKLSLSQKEFHFAAAGVTVDVPAASPRFRKAVFRVTSGCRAVSDCSNVAILYRSKQDEGHDLKLNSQSWRPSKEKPDQASLVILQHGGTISFHCEAAPACTAELQ